MVIFKDIKKTINFFFNRKINTKKFGSDYGGWFVATDFINENSLVYSFGIGEDVSFDIELIENYKVVIHAFDPTPKSIEWVKRQNLPDKFIMHEYGLADFDGTAVFNPPINPEHVSHTILDRPETSDKAIELPVKRLLTIFGELEHRHINILKMDIEGAEYGVIHDMYNCGIKPDQILVEFHDRFNGVGKKHTANAIKLLKKMGYIVSHISDSLEEFSFVKKELLTKRGVNG